MAAQCIFPAELIGQIFYFMDPLDIVRLRAVSKWFRTLTYDRALWKSLYANAPYPRPPGPFTSQSNASLERNLVKSARLAQSWTTRPIRDISCVKTELKGERFTPTPRLIHGRWFVACELVRRLVLHDTETGAQRILWEQDGLRVTPWDVCSMASVEGQCIVYVFLAWESRSSSESILSGWKLLDFRLNGESGELVDLAVVDGPADISFHYYGGEKFCARNSPFLSVPTVPRLVFDTRTRVFYELPEFRVALDETFWYTGFGNYPTVTQIALTNTYIILFARYAAFRYPTVIQVFTLPPDGSSVKNGNRVLCLTHEGAMENFHLLDVEVLNPLVRPVTGTACLSLLDYTARPGRFQVTRIDLTLPEPCADGVSPMTVRMQHYGSPNEGEPISRYKTCFQYVDVSEEGEVRGFYRWIPQRRPFEEYENDHIMKFTIDTRQDEWVIDCGKFLLAEWSHLEDTWLIGGIMFDGMRGKICFTEPLYRSTMVVVDIE